MHIFTHYFQVDTVCCYTPLPFASIYLQAANFTAILHGAPQAPTLPTVGLQRNFLVHGIKLQTKEQNRTSTGGTTTLQLQNGRKGTDQAGCQLKACCREVSCISVRILGRMSGRLRQGQASAFKPKLCKPFSLLWTNTSGRAAAFSH